MPVRATIAHNISISREKCAMQEKPSNLSLAVQAFAQAVDLWSERAAAFERLLICSPELDTGQKTDQAEVPSDQPLHCAKQ